MRRFRLSALLAGLCVLAGGLTQAQDQKWSTIKGQVKLSAPPEPKAVDVQTDKAFCAKDGPVVYEDLLVDPKSKGVKNVVVWLRPDTDNRKDPFPADKIAPALAKAGPTNRVIDQPCCQFEPRVLAARAGDTLEIKNSAKVPHNINYASDADPFNVTVQPGNAVKASKPLEAQTTPIPFKCDIHPWMAGRLRVFDHPYFAVTDADGRFEIKDAPDGDWRLVVWHENGFHKGKAGVLGQKVTVKGGTMEMDPIELELPK